LILNRAPARRSPARGYSLVELLLALLLVSVVLGGVMMAFFRTSAQAENLVAVTDRRQSARTGVQLIERELRTAGSGFGRMPVYGNNSAGQPIVLSAVTPGYSSPAADDSLVMMGAWQVSTTVQAQMPTPSANLKVQDVTGFNDGDLVLVCHGQYANMFQVTSSNSSSQTLQHNPASPYNNPGGMNSASGTWPSSGYTVGSIVCKLTISSFYIDRTSYRKPVLMRHEYMQAPQMIAYNVDGMRVWYELQDGSWTRNPKDLMKVTKVCPVVLTRVTALNRPALVDSVWSAVQPRVF
jgi:prepilin-type N-terminal cleavage/methylation domain-containing protein